MKKLITLLGVLLIVGLSGCSKDDGITINYEVIYHTNGGTAITNGMVEEGSTLSLPSDPVKVGYEFSGWYLDEALTVAYESHSIVNSTVDLYAKYAPLVTNLYLYSGDRKIFEYTVEYGEEFTLPVLTKYGYTYNGWYEEDTFDHEVSIVTGGLEDQEVYVEFLIDLTKLEYYEYLSTTNPVVTITVENMGVLTLELFPSIAKNTVDNFISYIQGGQYSGSTFHRVIEDFMIQGGIVSTTSCPITGDFSTNGVTNDLSHTKGVISMARTNNPNSATSQFFIVHMDSTFLDGSYAAFGGLTSGFDVLNSIASINTNLNDAPTTAVVIESITIELNGYVVDDVVCYE